MSQALKDYKKVIFFHDATLFFIKNRNKLKQLVFEILTKEGLTISAIHFWFMDDAKITQINKKHLKHNYATDVITFVYEQAPLSADVFLGAETIFDNAQHYQVSRAEETLRVIIHATLHMLGQGDKTEEEKKKMRTLEDYWIDMFHVKHKTPRKKHFS